MKENENINQSEQDEKTDSEKVKSAYMQAADAFVKASMDYIAESPTTRGLFVVVTEKGEKNLSTMNATVGAGQLLAKGLACCLLKEENSEAYDLVKFVVETIEEENIQTIVAKKLLQRLSNM